MQAMRKRWAATLLAMLAGVALLSSCNSDKVTGNQPVVVARLSLTPTTDTVLVGDSLTLSAAAEDANGLPIARTIAWSSSNPAVASVSAEGVVKAHDSGIVTITAAADGLVATAQLMVLERVTTMTMTSDGTPDTLRIRDTLYLHVQQHDPHGAALQRQVTWMTSDESVVTVGVESGATPAAAQAPAHNSAPSANTVVGGVRGYALAVGPGTAIVTAESEGIVDSITVTVGQPIATMEIAPAAPTVGLGAHLRLQARMRDQFQNELHLGVAWASSDPTVVTIDSAGTLNGVKLGTATITASAEDKSATVTVTVTTAAAGFVVEPTTASVMVGRTLQPTFTVIDASGATVARVPQWTSANPAIATVDANGLITGVAVGTTTVTGTVDNLSANIEVTVIPAAATMTIAPSTLTIAMGETVDFTVTMTAADGSAITDRTVVWTTSEPFRMLIDSKGHGTARNGGPVTITATAGDLSASAQVNVTVPVASVTVAPAVDSLTVGETVQLTGTARNMYGGALSGMSINWSSNHPEVATVSGSGLVTAVAVGSATISGSHGEFSGASTISVFAVPASVDVTPGHVQLRVGDNTTLHGTPRDAGGSAIGGKVTYTTSDPTIATVSSDGTVTALKEGTVTITATSGGKSGSTTVVVSGEKPTTETEFGNNLSVPVVFSEGIGLGGLPVTVEGARNALNTGLRPGSTENLTVDAWPFFYAGNKADQGAYYLQQTLNTWQADWRDGTAMGMQHAEAAWGDNLTHHTWNTGAPIRVEVSLNDLSSGPLTGYNMTVISGSRNTEVQGTDGSTASMTPTIYSVVPRLVVQRISGENGTVVQELVNKGVVEGFGAEEGPGVFAAEVNVGGKVLYGYNLNIGSLSLNPGVDPVGWYRIGFVLESRATTSTIDVSRNVVIDQVANAAAVDSEGETLKYTPQVSAEGNATWVDIYVDSAKGSGNGGGGETGGDTGAGNNLSVPVTFAEGIGLTGLPVSQDPGLRPDTTTGIVIAARPFFYSGNTSDCSVGGTQYFCQNGANTWQAQWYNAAGQARRDAEVAWGDNVLTNHFNTHMNVHVEVTLTDLTTPPMMGYNMTVVSGTGSTELQGTDGSTAMFTPTVYTRGARFTVQKLDDATRAPIYTLLDQGVWQGGDGPGQFATEVSMGGTVVYSYNLLIQNISIPDVTFHKYGWWRFTFTLDNSAPVSPNVIMTRLAGSEESGGDEGGSGGSGSGGSGSGGVPSKNVPVLNPNGLVTSIDVYIDKGGGSGSGEHI